MTRKPREVVPTEWRAVETDEAAGVYITAMDALNLALGPLGDWHRTLWRRAVGSAGSTRTPATERLCRIGRERWGREELVDARDALRLIGHPAGAEETPVWAASHPRAVAEMVIGALASTGWIPDPDPASARRWLTAGQRATCARLLAGARSALATGAERDALDGWLDSLQGGKSNR